MKNDSDKQLTLNFDAAANQFQPNEQRKISSNLRLIYSAELNTNVNPSVGSTVFFTKNDEKLFQPIIEHARSLSW